MFTDHKKMNTTKKKRYKITKHKYWMHTMENENKLSLKFVSLLCNLHALSSVHSLRACLVFSPVLFSFNRKLIWIIKKIPMIIKLQQHQVHAEIIKDQKFERLEKNGI